MSLAEEIEVAYGWWICSPDGWKPMSDQVDIEAKLGVVFDSRFDMGVAEQCWAIWQGLAEMPRKER